MPLTKTTSSASISLAIAPTVAFALLSRWFVGVVAVIRVLLCSGEDVVAVSCGVWFRARLRVGDSVFDASSRLILDRLDLRIVEDSVGEQGILEGREGITAGHAFEIGAVPLR